MYDSMAWDIWMIVNKYRTRSVLIVEDDEVVRPLIVHLLQNVDPEIEITWTTNLSDAESELNAYSFDLVIADYMLPKGKTGMELWGTCQQQRPRTPILIMSSLSKEKFQMLIGEGRTLPPFLEKPVSPLRWQGVLRTLLG